MTKRLITANVLSDIPAEVLARLRLGDPTLVCVDPGDYTPLVYLAEALVEFQTDGEHEPWVSAPKEGWRLPVLDLGVAVTLQCRNLEDQSGDFFYGLPWVRSALVRCKDPSWKAHTRLLDKLGW